MLTGGDGGAAGLAAQKVAIGGLRVISLKCFLTLAEHGKIVRVCPRNSIRRFRQVSALPG